MSQREEKHFECLSKEVNQDERFKNILLKRRVIQSINEGSLQKLGSWLTWSKSPKQIILEKVEGELSEMILIFQLKCVLNFKFGQLFDSFFENEFSLEQFATRDDDEDYCMRRELTTELEQYYSNMQIINENYVGKNFNCAKVLQSLRIGIVDVLREFDLETSDAAKKQCTLSILLSDNRYLNILFKADLLSQLNLNLEEREKEKQNFVTEMTKISINYVDYWSSRNLIQLESILSRFISIH
ncbi:CLUMA_CG002809, isoform A [Clunio marinus]|uniref:CLUMA_CG002809, isoform A n=1 Tax=Clunio marinus TaxID=568069 RepID=A0A1J1HMF4_9DIPT|nr:CLUMA_CG002809, isoform A [Clunio marinus]